MLRVSKCRRKEKKITPPKTKIKTATVLELNIRVTAKHTTHLFFGVPYLNKIIKIHLMVLTGQ